MLEKIPTGIGRALGNVRAGPAKLVSADSAFVGVPETITLTSHAFADGDRLPARFTKDGAGVSPPLNWRLAGDAASLVLVVEDADTPALDPFVHAIAWDLPVTGSEGTIAEGLLDSSRTPMGRNSYQRAEWTPCDPPTGHGTHRYYFQLFALDTRLGFDKPPGRSALVEAMRGHVLARGSLVGTYERYPRDGRRALGGVAITAGAALLGFALSRWLKDARQRGLVGNFRDDAPGRVGRGAKRREAEAAERGAAVAGCTVTIKRPRTELYRFWRDFTNLASVMENIERIEVIDDKRSHWVVKAPGGTSVEWDAVVTEDEPGQLIAWESAPGADVRNSGRVEFLEAPPGRGTVVRATIAYDPPGGAAGRWAAKLLQREPNVQARRDLRRFKQLMETGEITSSASPSARRSESPTEQKL